MKAVLVDDERLALDYLERQIQKNGQIEVVGTFMHLDLNKESRLIKHVDVVFLDIEMPGINGLEMAEQLIEINPDLFVVFVTAFNEYAVRAFELNALDYMLKPVRQNRLQKTIERLKNKINHSTHIYSEEILRVRVCGNLMFELNDDKFEPLSWRTAKSQELFLFLLHHQGKIIHKSKLVELLWPELETDKAYSQLYTAIYHIRKTLKNLRNHFSIKNKNEGYILIANNVAIDIVEWENRIRSLIPLDDTNIHEYEKHMDLYTSSYLQEYNYLWAESERFRLEQLWINVAYQIGEYYYNQNDLEKAETWFVKICDYRPDEENAHFLLMKLYASFGYGVLVEHQYAQLIKSLRELSLDISTHIKDWYSQWRQERNPIH